MQEEPEFSFRDRSNNVEVQSSKAIATPSVKKLFRVRHTNESEILPAKHEEGIAVKAFAH